MKLIIHVECDFTSEADTEFEVPDNATPEQVSAFVDEMRKSGKVSWPNLLDGELTASSLEVFYSDDDGDLDFDRGPVEGSERYW